MGGPVRRVLFAALRTKRLALTITGLRHAYPSGTVAALAPQERRNVISANSGRDFVLPPAVIGVPRPHALTKIGWHCPAHLSASLAIAPQKRRNVSKAAGSVLRIVPRNLLNKMPFTELGFID